MDAILRPWIEELPEEWKDLYFRMRDAEVEDPEGRTLLALAFELDPSKPPELLIPEIEDQANQLEADLDENMPHLLDGLYEQMNEVSVREAGDFQEEEHPRDESGKFTSKGGGGGGAGPKEKTGSKEKTGGFAKTDREDPYPRSERFGRTVGDMGTEGYLGREYWGEDYVGDNLHDRAADIMGIYAGTFLNAVPLAGTLTQTVMRDLSMRQFKKYKLPEGDYSWDKFKQDVVQGWTQKGHPGDFKSKAIGSAWSVPKNILSAGVMSALCPPRDRPVNWAVDIVGRGAAVTAGAALSSIATQVQRRYIHGNTPVQGWALGGLKMAGVAIKTFNQLPFTRMMSPQVMAATVLGCAATGAMIGLVQKGIEKTGRGKKVMDWLRDKGGPIRSVGLITGLLGAWGMSQMAVYRPREWVALKDKLSTWGDVAKDEFDLYGAKGKGPISFEHEHWGGGPNKHERDIMSDTIDAEFRELNPDEWDIDSFRKPKSLPWRAS